MIKIRIVVLCEPSFFVCEMDIILYTIRLPLPAITVYLLLNE